MINKKILLIIPILTTTLFLNSESYFLGINKNVVKNIIVNQTNNESETSNEPEITILNKTCLDILNAGESIGDGNYTVYPDGSTPLNVYCDMTIDGGGWTLVYYSNLDSVSRDQLATGDWNSGANINFSYLYSFKDINRNGRYEFFIHDSSTIFRHVIFNQTNAYNENPVGNDFIQTGGNFYYSSQASGWQGLSLGNYGNESMNNHCSLSMSYEGLSWTYCLQDQLPNAYNTGPWFYDVNIGGYDENSQQWVRIYQR